MSKPSFPSRRFRGLGASREEVAEMERAYNASDLVVQRDQAAYLRSLSVAHLREYLTGWRANSVDDVFEVEDDDTALTGGLTKTSDDLDPEKDADVGPFDE